MAIDKTDFLRFSAYSMKDLITRKLSEDTAFTDQIYEGSNLAILIDLVSYMYQCLIYQLNNAASESMFQDTQIYENIQRLCNFIGYHPRGFKPSQMQIYVYQTKQIENLTGFPVIYRGSRFDTGMSDSRGRRIYFSTDFSNDITLTQRGMAEITLINGQWKLYPTVFIATGSEYETFELAGLKSDSENKQYIADGYIKAYVIPENGSFEDIADNEWNCDHDEIFVQATSRLGSNESRIDSDLYKYNSQVYSVYMNSDKCWEIKFGNGISGQKLKKGDRVYVLYLDTNGPDGYVDLNELDVENFKLEHSPAIFGMQQNMYDAVFTPAATSNQNLATPESSECISFGINYNSLTMPREEENVDEIRENAPAWFKTGNRLITKKDYEYYLKQQDSFIDVKCMNNWDYMTTFYRWLYNLGIAPSEDYKNILPAGEAESFKPDGYRYLNAARILQSGYQYVDSADANNIYLWIKATNGSLVDKAAIDTQIQYIKTMTSETYPLTPIDVYFDISITPKPLYLQNIDNPALDAGYSYLEITMSDNCVYSNTSIVNQIVDIIKEQFKPLNCRLGQAILYDEILNKIYSINGVERVRTVFYPEDESILNQYGPRSCDGISFASWTCAPELIQHVGIDLEVSNTVRQIYDFQFPTYLPSAAISDKIKIIKKTMNTTNPVRF